MVQENIVLKPEWVSELHLKKAELDRDCPNCSLKERTEGQHLPPFHLKMREARKAKAEQRSQEVQELRHQMWNVPGQLWTQWAERYRMRRG